MKQKYTTQFFMLITIISIWGCTPTIDPPVPQVGSLDFSNYVAFGGSMTAGVSNRDVRTEGELPVGGLYHEAQLSSFPAILANQIKLGQPIDFTQPLVEGNGSSYVKLDGFRATCDNFSPTPDMSLAEETRGWIMPVEAGSRYNNKGIPDLRMRDAHSLGHQDPFYERVIGDSMTYMDAIAQAEPTFFTLWLGLEDFFQYAYLGGRGEPVMEASLYGEQLAEMLQELMENPDMRGCVANIPDITKMPFFQSIKPLAHELDCTPQNLWIETNDFEIVPAREDDMVLLTCFDNVLGQIGGGWGSTQNNPVPNKYVFDEYEVSQLRSKILRFNQAIKEIVDEINADGKRIVLVDTYTLFEQIYQGKFVNGIQMNADFIYGSFFSLDGVYSTARGNALIANHFIRSINAAFPGTNIPPADVTRYAGVRFP